MKNVKVWGISSRDEARMENIVLLCRDPALNKQDLTLPDSMKTARFNLNVTANL